MGNVVGVFVGSSIIEICQMLESAPKLRQNSPLLLIINQEARFCTLFDRNCFV